MRCAIGICFFMAILFSSCNYKPDGEYYEELSGEGTPPSVKVNLNFATDTIYICRNDWVEFSYAYNGDSVNWSRFIINGVETSPNDDDHGGFECLYHFNNFTPGTYPLILQLFTHSGTGSIADCVGTEGFLMQAEWTVVITDCYSLACDVTSAELSDGTITVSWEMYKGLNFKSYDLYKDMPYIAECIVHVATITNQEQTTYTDNTYHGESSRYYVVVNNEFRGEWFPVEGPLPAFTASNAENGDIILSWEVPLFYNNLKGYKVSYLDKATGQLNELKKIDNPQATTCTVTDPLWAYEYNFYLTMVPKSDNFYDDWTFRQFLSSRATASCGEKSPAFSSAQSGTEPLVYLFNYSGISVYDTEHDSVIRTIKNEPSISAFNVSAGNKYLLTTLSQPRQFYLNDLNNPANSKLIDFSGIFTNTGHLAAVADNGTGAILSGQKVVLYDFVSGTQLAEAQLKYNGLYSVKISPDGTFLFVQNYGGFEFFRYKDGQLSVVSELQQSDDPALFAAFLPGDPNKLVRVRSSQQVDVINCRTLSVENSWTLNNAVTNMDIFNLDISSRQLFLKQGSNLALIDITSGDINTVATLGEDNYQVSKWDLIYNNGRVLWNEGKQMKIKNN